MKGGKFSMVSRSIWRSARFKRVNSDKGKLAFFYFLACEHQNGLGCYRLPDGYAIDDLGWTPEEYREAKAECEHAQLIQYDTGTQELLIEKWLENNPAQNRKHLTGMAKSATHIESIEFQRIINEHLLEMNEKLPSSDNNPARPGLLR